MIEVFFDVETKKLFSEIEGSDPGGLGVSLVSAYKRELNANFAEISGRIQSFWEDDFAKLWALFREADRIIGFNSLKFDLPALQPYTTIPLSKFIHFDILEKVKNALGKRIGLNALAKETLGREKTDVGVNAVYYWQSGDTESLRKLQRYCEADVLLTRDLYDYVLVNGHLKYKDKWNTPRVIELDFSYPKARPTEKQIGLF